MKNALADGSLNIYELTLTGGSRVFGGSVINYQGDFFASGVNFFENSAYPDYDQAAAGGGIYSYSGVRP